MLGLSQNRSYEVIAPTLPLKKSTRMAENHRHFCNSSMILPHKSGFAIDLN